MRSFIPVLLSGLAAAGQTVPPSPINQVEIAPIFDRPFACTEHPEGQLPEKGDALGTDCMVVGGISEGGFSRMYRTDGSRNEDWFGWHANVHAPFDGVVKLVHVNPTTNVPGSLGKPPASFVLMERSDGVAVLYAHVEGIRVKAGDAIKAGQVIAVVGNNGMARNPHTHIGAFRGDEPLQIRWDLRAEGAVAGLKGS